jgi:outer membrane receptor protein involved in Fe transport
LITGGNPRLEAESADTYTLGFVWQAQGPNLNVSVDWYQIEIGNVVGMLAFLTAYEQCFNANGKSNPTYTIDNEYCQRITRDPNNAEPLLVYGGNFNLSQRLTSGVDFTVTWTRDLAGGTFGIRSSAEQAPRVAATGALGSRRAAVRVRGLRFRLRSAGVHCVLVS